VSLALFFLVSLAALSAARRLDALRFGGAR
jgi:hypothetical protein